MKNKFRTIIIDDELFARKDILRLLSHHPEIEVIGEADSVRSAATKITELQPDLIFLDIEMQDGSGFQLFDLVEVSFKVVFITAFDNYAIRAFEVNAFDYLLKPVSPTRLARTIARLHEKSSPSVAALTKLLNYDDYLFIKGSGHAGFIKVSSIVSITASVDASEIILNNGESRLLSRSLREWEAHLPMQHFLRIHRGAIINVAFVERVETWPRSTYQVFMKHIPEPLVASRRYAGELKKRFF